MENVDLVITKMSIKEKIAQLFITNPEALINGEEPVREVSVRLREAFSTTPIGGLLYFSKNLSSPRQTKRLLDDTQVFSATKTGLPLFQCIDEEGGWVARIANSSSFCVKNIGPAAEFGKTGDEKLVREKGSYVGRYLADLGFNVDFAPCADVLSNSRNTVIGTRAYGSDPHIVANMALAFAQGLSQSGIIPVFKHFPGHGDTEGDSHLGYAFSNKTMDDILQCEMVPFVKGIEEKIPMIMVGHISLPNVTKNEEPASLSRQIITDLLRNRLGYDGVIITDSFMMKAISNIYSSEEAAVRVLEAGADIILRPMDFFEAYNGVIHAVNSGRIAEKRIDESLRRVLLVKEMIIK